MSGMMTLDVDASVSLLFLESFPSGAGIDAGLSESCQGTIDVKEEEDLRGFFGGGRGGPKEYI